MCVAGQTKALMAMMNLIVNNRKLDKQQEQAIYELTLKKQRSKKSRVSQRQVVAMQQLADDLAEQRKELSETRLGQLNEELERLLSQYEYLVAQEKAILSAYNMHMFTSQSVNNFHLFELARDRSAINNSQLLTPSFIFYSFGHKANQNSKSSASLSSSSSS